jgi:SAM-dependent methyltransferase
MINTLNEALHFWEGKHRKYATQDWNERHNSLAGIAVEMLPADSRVLELGCGQGQDAVYIAEHGHYVLATDFSPYALSHFPAAADAVAVERMQLDAAATPYPLSSQSFDAVYAHLSVHYFPAQTTRAIFEEVGRVLRPPGLFFALFNSVRDPECGTGTPLEPSYWELSSGDRKRFFSCEEMPGLLGEGFRVIRAEFGKGTRKSASDEYVLLIAQQQIAGSL